MIKYKYIYIYIRKILKKKQKKMFKCLKKSLNLLNMKTFLNFNKNSNHLWINNMYLNLIKKF